MKKVYTKPLVYVENQTADKIVSNSDQYAAEIRAKVEKFRKMQEKEREN